MAESDQCLPRLAIQLRLWMTRRPVMPTSPTPSSVRFECCATMCGPVGRFGEVETSGDERACALRKQVFDCDVFGKNPLLDAVLHDRLEGRPVGFNPIRERVASY